MDHSTAYRLRFLLVPLLALLALAAQGQVLKCVGPKGQVEFSNQSCQKGWTRQELAIKENTVSQSGAREQALLLENERLKAQLEQAKTAPTSAATASASAGAQTLTEADLAAQRLKSPACEDAARRYEIAAGSIAPVADLIAARRSAMFAACGIREPDSVSVKTNVQVEAARPCVFWGWRVVQFRTGQIQYVRTCLAWGSR